MLALFLLSAGFQFTDVSAWKTVEGRTDAIPALTATLDNNTGDDWREARFRVTVACREGGERVFSVLLRDLPRGRQSVRETAFDSIGRVEPCEGNSRVDFLEGIAVPPAERASYVVLGFAFRAGAGPPLLDLEGLLDYRQPDSSQASTSPVFWRGRGERLELPGADDTAFYIFRIPPGRFGLAGFLLNRDPQSAIPSRFLRMVEIPPDRAAFLGSFLIERTANGLVSVVIDPSDAAWHSLQARFPSYRGRTWVRPPILRLPSTSSLVRE